jgi:hypothetical protein
MRCSIGIAVAAALASSSCFFEVDHTPRQGTLVIDWTVDGSKSPAACRHFRADTLDIVIHTSDGIFVDELREYCGSFATSIDLLPDSYAIDAVLLDVNGVELTSAVTDRLPVYRYETSVSAIDFPADSFF